MTSTLHRNLCTFMTTLVANITTITSVPKITMLAFATTVTSVTRVTYILCCNWSANAVQTYRIIFSLGRVSAS